MPGGPKGTVHHIFNGKEVRIHKYCIPLMHEKISSHQKILELKKKETAEKHASNFTNISYDLDSEVEAIILFNYSQPKESRLKLFCSRENNTTIFSRDQLQTNSYNIVHLKIEPTTRKNAKLLSGGNYEFDDSFESGYSLVINLKYEDSKFRHDTIDILKQYEFGSMPSDYTIHAHLNKENPTLSEAKEIFAKIIQDIKNAIFS